MASNNTEVLKNIRSLLDYHRSSGIEGYPLVDDVHSFLKLKAAVSTPKRSNKANVLQKTVSSNNIVPKNPETNKGTLDEIAAEVKMCSSCDLSLKRILPVSGRGGQKVRLFVVGGFLTVGADRPMGASDSLVFGEEEDLMLARMFKAIQLSAEDVFVTNIIKCGVPENVQPKAENINACVSYLHRQIAAASPNMICAMGILAAKALLDVPKPLSQLRGTFHRYSIAKDKYIPLMATYHPSFLLKNPEMKGATWADLQLIEKGLKS